MLIGCPEISPLLSHSPREKWGSILLIQHSRARDLARSGSGLLAAREILPSA